MHPVERRVDKSLNKKAEILANAILKKEQIVRMKKAF
jgi:hypothetical protein